MTAGRFAWEKAMRDSDLRSTTRLVALVLATYADQDGGSIRPSVETVAHGCGLGTRAVRNALAELTDAGWITSRDGRRPGVDPRVRRLVIPPVQGVHVGAGVHEQTGDGCTYVPEGVHVGAPNQPVTNPLSSGAVA